MTASPRTSRRTLSSARIVEAAAEVADEQGFDQFTLAAVAKRCEVTLPGLYKHVECLDAVRRAVAVEAVREVTAAMALASAGLSGRSALFAACRAYRDFAAAHPGRAAALVRAPEPADAEHNAAAAAAVGLLAAVIGGYGIEGDDAIDAVRSLRAVLHGFATLETGGGFGLARPAEATFRHLLDGLDVAFQNWTRSGEDSQRDPRPEEKP